MMLLVTGSRKGHDMVEERLDELHKEHCFSLMMNGCAEGVDTQAAEWADYIGLPYLDAPALWNAYGKKAGTERNQFMASLMNDLSIARGEGVVVAAFPRPGSKGTWDMVRRAESYGFLVEVYK
jgi:hypothetical protein